jgi:hypothetical protein
MTGDASFVSPGDDSARRQLAPKRRLTAGRQLDGVADHVAQVAG